MQIWYLIFVFNSEDHFAKGLKFSTQLYTPLMFKRERLLDKVKTNTSPLSEPLRNWKPLHSPITWSDSYLSFPLIQSKIHIKHGSYFSFILFRFEIKNFWDEYSLCMGPLVRVLVSVQCTLEAPSPFVIRKYLQVFPSDSRDQENWFWLRPTTDLSQRQIMHPDKLKNEDKWDHCISFKIYMCSYTQKSLGYKINFCYLKHIFFRNKKPKHLACINLQHSLKRVHVSYRIAWF